MYKLENEQIQMGYTISEFSSVLHGNFSSADSKFSCEDLSPDSWIITQDLSQFRMHIQVQQLAARSLGLLELPVLGVSFKPISGTSSEKQLFFEKFFRYFHKGGG